MWGSLLLEGVQIMRRLANSILDATSSSLLPSKSSEHTQLPGTKPMSRGALPTASTRSYGPIPQPENERPNFQIRQC